MDSTEGEYLRPANRSAPQVDQFARITQSNKCVIRDQYDRYHRSSPSTLLVASHKISNSHKIYCTMLILLTQSICNHIDPADGSHLNHTTSDHNRPLSWGSSLGSTVIIIRNGNHHQQHPHPLQQHQQQQQINRHHSSHHYTHTNHNHDHIVRRRQYRRSSSIDVSKNDSNLVNSNISNRLHQPNSLLTTKQMVQAVLNHTHHHHHHQNKSHTQNDNDYISNNTDYSESERELSNVRKNSLNGTPTFMNEEDYYKEEAEFQEYFMQFVIVADFVIFLVGLCGNLVVITVILKFTRNENVTDIYILNLAFADLTFIMGLFFMIITIYLEEFIFGNLICKVYMSITSINQYASSLLLVIMSFDRFIAVCHPIYAQHFRNPRRAKIICMMIWIISLTLMQPVFLYSKIAVQNYGSNIAENPNSEQYEDTGCRISWPESETIEYATLFTLYSFAIGFAIPLSLIACFYACVIRKLRMSASESITKSRSSRRTRARESTNKRIEHLVIAIILTYTICWLPYWIVQVYMSSIDLTKNEKFPFSVFPFIQTATTLSYTNSALNPILYAFLSDNFKRRFSEIIRSIYSIKWCRQDIVTETNSTVMSALT